MSDSGISMKELQAQISEVEGFDIALVGFVSRDRWNEVQNARYNPYPYKTPFSGTISDLIRQRIIPAINNVIK